MMKLFAIFILFSAICGHEAMSQGTEKVVVDDNFALNPFQIQVSEKSLKDKFPADYKVTVERISKEHTTAGDSIVAWTSQKNSFYFIRKSKKSIFYGAEIQSSNTRLFYGLHVGMSKSEVAKCFNAKSIKPNVLVVTDSNETCYHYFYFQNSILTKIKVDSCLD